MHNNNVTILTITLNTVHSEMSTSSASSKHGLQRDLYLHLQCRRHFQERQLREFRWVAPFRQVEEGHTLNWSINRNWSFKISPKTQKFPLLQNQYPPHFRKFTIRVWHSTYLGFRSRCRNQNQIWTSSCFWLAGTDHLLSEVYVLHCIALYDMTSNVWTVET